MGYKGVGIRGYYGWEASEGAEEALDRERLKCCGTHTGSIPSPDKLKATASSTHPGIHSISPAAVPTPRAARDGKRFFFHRSRPRPRRWACCVGYHPMPETSAGSATRPREIFFDNTGPDVIMQTTPALPGRGRSRGHPEEIPGRSASVHLKEHGGPRRRHRPGVVPWATSSKSAKRRSTVGMSSSTRSATTPWQHRVPRGAPEDGPRPLSRRRDAALEWRKGLS